MTHKQQHTQNKKLIGLYMDSLEHEELTYNQRLKLATEIGRLQLINNEIDNMTVEDYHKQSNNYQIKQPSFLNVTYT